ncbi:mechanosensitive ion channel family protein [Celeribacter indicus]|uniref:MscS mechanosensitive ion channel n=1 Tax=Celeribacter indicus TaxID=1208324 RepID=A0A0B5E4J3_9RHOB|nr:mechanosensitive ion channel family protein [Celeribacter indicus]AJE48285.1 MscS mechanosensitive ion channel [Celeribacter indicus]SDW71699.1 Mechanosensitive ion channel [Celeribacter indicus]
MTFQDLISRTEFFIRRLDYFMVDIAVILGAVLAGLAFNWALRGLIRRVYRDPSHVARVIMRQALIPARLMAVFLSLMIVLPLVSLPSVWLANIRHVMGIIFIVTLGWAAYIVGNHFTTRAMLRYQTDDEENLTARKTLTQLRVLRQVMFFAIFLFTAGGILLTFPGVREIGAGLFASAGVAGLVLGIAARPVLSNVFAGIQIALTQPIRLNDVVIVEGEWGWIEEITATYVVIRIWDWRRLVVPLTYFIEKPFENWTRDSTNVIGAVMWRVDYTAPVDEIRAKVQEFVRESPYWDGQVANLQVTDSASDVVELRGLMSARTSPRLWELRCEVREKLLTWLQRSYPTALPRTRASFEIKGETPEGGGPFGKMRAAE